MNLAATPLGLWITGAPYPGGKQNNSYNGSLREQLVPLNPYMLFFMISWLPVLLRPSLGLTVPPKGCLRRCSTKASVASRSGAAPQAAAGKMTGSQSRSLFHFYPPLVGAVLWILCFSCAGKKLRPTPLRKGRSAACASSCNPRTAFGQSGAQPEPRTPCGPNSNRCRSGGDRRQLVYVRMS